MKGGELVPEKFAVMAGKIYTKICSNWGNFADCQKNLEENDNNFVFFDYKVSTQQHFESHLF